MLIAGAKGHAIEVLELLMHETKHVVFFDDLSKDLPLKLYDIYPVITSLEDVTKYFANNKNFILGVGGSLARRTLTMKLEGAGGLLNSVIAGNADIGRYEVNLGEGVNIMNGVMVSNNVTVGRGSLINARVSIHHDCTIGEFTEIGPGCIITGGCTIGHDCSIGAGVILIPGIIIGDNVTIGAGAVVTKEITDGATIAGVPAKNMFT